MKAPFSIEFDERLGVYLPQLEVEYEQMSKEHQHEFELQCQQICSQIPERIRVLEQEYMKIYEALKEAEDDAEFMRYNDQMNELSRTICDLNLLYLHIEGSYLGAHVHG